MATTDTRMRILEAARSRFLHDGILGVSMRRIAGEVGISATAIYRHFADKDALLDAITNDGFDRLEERLRRALRHASPLRCIRGLARELVRFSLAHPNHYDFIFIIPRQNVRRFPDDFAQRRSATFNLLLQQVVAGMERRELAPDDALELSLSIWANQHGLIALHRAGRFPGDPKDFQALCERSLERLLNGIRA